MTANKMPEMPEMMTPTEKDAMALDDAGAMAVINAAIEEIRRYRESIGLKDFSITIPDLRAARAHLASRIAELEAENERAWAAANRADAKVRGWEATMVCTGLPFRACSVDGWGPGADGTVEVPALTTEKLTSILDRLARAEAELAAVRANAERYLHLREANNADPTPFIAQRYEHGIMQWRGEEADAAIDAARGGE